MMYKQYNGGLIEVITGPMFSGKSEELIKRIKILGFAELKILVVKPKIDTRWSKKQIVSRSGTSVATISAENTKTIALKVKDKQYDVIAIDEVQFFDSKIINLIVDLANKGTRVIVSGLDLDFKGKPFGSMPNILAHADIVDKHTAVCQVCKKAATMTYRKTKSADLVEIGSNKYEPRCRHCHQIRK